MAFYNIGCPNYQSQRCQHANKNTSDDLDVANLPTLPTRKQEAAEKSQKGKLDKKRSPTASMRMPQQLDFRQQLDSAEPNRDRGADGAGAEQNTATSPPIRARLGVEHTHRQHRHPIQQNAIEHFRISGKELERKHQSE